MAKNADIKSERDVLLQMNQSIVEGFCISFPMPAYFIVIKALVHYKDHRGRESVVLGVGNGERVFFDADDGINGRQLWVSDATVNGTQRIVDTGDSASLSSSAQVVAWGQGVVVNTASDELLWTDGVTLTPVFSHPSFSTLQQQNLDTLTLGMTTFATEMLHANSTNLWFSAKSQHDIEPHLLTLDADFQSWKTGC